MGPEAGGNGSPGGRSRREPDGREPDAAPGTPRTAGDDGERPLPLAGGLRPEALVEFLAPRLDEMTSLLVRLAELETPTTDPESQAPIQRLLEEEWAALGYRARRIPGRDTGGHRLFVPLDRCREVPVQMMLGHMDTVWPRGTLAEMPVREDGGRLHGPGVFDMKAGLVQMLFAVRALQELGVEPPATPVAFINSDEETGSPESKGNVARLARAVARTFVVEPCFGPEGRLKTARKGVGNFEVVVRGKATHAGLDPEGGASAIQELAHVIQALHGMTELDRGLTVNVGVVEGGTRANVIAARARARVDVRARTVADAEEVTARILVLEARVPGTRLDISGGFRVPPLERTPRNRRLWYQARGLGRAMGFELGEVEAGGGSDGNTTSRYTATLDGLGARGDGAHADHEHVVLESLVDRTALLAGLLASPVESPGVGTGAG